jgi:threonine/homoserine/homoserine lactone efflux protein
MPATSLLAVFVFSFAVSFGAVVSPGPVTAAIVSEAPRQGWRTGPLISGGHSLMELLIVITIGLGLSTALALPVIRRAVALGGGLLLLFMGATYLLAVLRGSVRLPAPGDQPAPRTGVSILSLGVLATISNPFWYAWWVTVAAGYLAQARAIGLAAIAAFYLGHISADFAWNTALATATSTGRRWLSDRGYRALIAVAGGFMLYLGVVFLRSGL